MMISHPQEPAASEPDDTVPAWLQPFLDQYDPQKTPFLDHGARILREDSTLDDETRAKGWDAFHSAANPQELVRNLSSLEIPSETKQKLFDAKSVTAPVPTNVDKVSAALQKVSQLDPAVLEAAESHPRLAKAFIDAATKDSE